jgi:hypothetical protein
MSLGGGYSSSQGKSTSFSKWTLPLFKDMVLPFVQQLQAKFDGTGGPMRAAAETQYGDTLAGKYLSPETNPNLAATADVIQRNSQQALDQALAKINGGAAQNGTLFSTKTNQIAGDTARRSVQDTTDRVTQLYGGNYAAERQQQAGAADRALAASQLDLDQLFKFFDILKGGTSTNRSSSIQGSVSA